MVKKRKSIEKKKNMNMVGLLSRPMQNRIKFMIAQMAAQIEQTSLIMEEVIPRLSFPRRTRCILSQ